ncbi:MAG: alkaline shock response membrane anchor protein AmaP [Bacillota bacterium]
MHIVDRIVLVLYTFAMAFLSALAVLMAFGWRVPLEIFVTTLDTASGRLTTGIVGAGLLIVSLRFIYYGFQRRSRPFQTIVHETGLGQVRVSLGAIESLVQRVARQSRGVKSVRGWVENRDDGIAAFLTIVVSPDSSIPETTREIQQNIKAYVNDVVGIGVEEVRVFVENISNEVKRGRVR